MKFRYYLLAFGLMLAAARLIAGCGLSAADGQHFSDLSTKLAGCREEAYGAADAGATSAAARMRYEDCKRREGIEGVQ